MSFNVPVILLKNVVILPNQEIKVELYNLISGKTINDATTNYKGEILVVTPIDALEEEPSVEDLPNVGVIAKIKNKIDNNGCIQVRLRGIKRVAVNKYFQKENNEILYSNVMYIDLPSLVKEEENAINKKMVETLKEYINVSKGVSNDILSFISACLSLHFSSTTSTISYTILFSSPITTSRFLNPISVSINTTFLPSNAKLEPRFAVVVVFPTPPFPDVITITSPIFFLLRIILVNLKS